MLRIAKCCTTYLNCFNMFINNNNNKNDNNANNKLFCV